MAEFFVFDWTYRHWMDDLTPQQVADMEAQYPGFTLKYNRRFQAGDIKEVYPDGHLPAGETISPATKEVCIKVPSISYATAKQYRDSMPDIVTGARRRHKVDWANVPKAIKDQLALTRVATVTNISQIELIDKAS